MDEIKKCPTTINEFEEGGFRRIELKNDDLIIEFIPELGGKMSKFVRRETGHQFLLESQLPEGGYHHAEYGANFELQDTSGFDECFPTVSDSTVSVVKNGVPRQIDFPDHGELWSRPWKAEIEGHTLVLSIDGVKVDYRFEKVIRLDGDRVEIAYHLKNNDTFAFPFLWSSHPLLKLAPGAEIYTEPLDQVFINWTSEESIGTFGDVIDWPNIKVGDQEVDFSRVPEKMIGVTAKLFSDKLEHGFAALYRPDWDETFSFVFNAERVPYLGLWTCYGGWPTDGRPKHYTLGLEPATGRPDALGEAVARNECPVLEAGQSAAWSLRMSAQAGKFDFDDYLNSTK